MSFVSGFPRAVSSAVIPGGPVGAHEVPGALDPGDDLISVRNVSGDLVTNADLTGEFSITAGTANSVTNTTTDTTGDFLIVAWARSS